MELKDEDAEMIGKRILTAIEHDGVFGLGLLVREIKAGMALVDMPKPAPVRSTMGEDTTRRVQVRGLLYEYDGRVFREDHVRDLIIRCNDVGLSLPKSIRPVADVERKEMSDAFVEAFKRYRDNVLSPPGFKAPDPWR